MIELEIREPGQGLLVTLIDKDTVAEVIAENLPYVAEGTRFFVNGEEV